MDFKEILNFIPEVSYVPEYDPAVNIPCGTVRALFYEGMNYNNRKTRIFAYLGIPDCAEKFAVPAVVLVHGGGGHAYYEWVRRWMEKGYAAIAMDTEGYFPDDAYKGIAGGFEGEPREMYTRFGDDDDYASIPSAASAGGNVCESEDTPLSEQWIYHAVSAVIAAHNILKNDCRILSNCIGICGISWGSVVSSIAIGYDNRFAFAINVYGSAFLEHSLSGIMRPFRRISPNNYQNATANIGNVKFPVLWMCWNYDQCFSILPNSLSYLATRDCGSRLCIKNEWSHSHSHAWNSAEPYVFADYAIGKKEFIEIITEEKSDNGSVKWRINGNSPIKSTRVFYLTSPMKYSENSWMLNEWKTVEAELIGNTVYAGLPDNSESYYLEVTAGFDSGRYTVCSEYTVKSQT